MTLYTTNMQVLHGSWLQIIHSAFCKNLLMYIGMRTHMYMYIQDYAHVHLPAHLHTLTHTSKTNTCKETCAYKSKTACKMVHAWRV